MCRSWLMLAGLVLGTAAALPGAGLALAGAIAEARERSPDAAMARARVEEAQAYQREAESGRLPRIDARAGYLQTTNPMQGFGAILSQGSFDNEVNFNDPGQLDAFTGTLEARYRVYAGGGLEAGIRSRGALLKAGEMELASTESMLELAVAESYFGIREAEEVLLSLDAGIRALEESLRVAREREQAGDLLRTERLNIEVELSALRQQRLAAENAARVAKIRMALLLGRPALEEIELAGEDPSVERIREPDALAISGRPELEAARAAVEAAAEAVKGARSGRLPAVDAFASWQYDKGWRREGDGDSWTAGLMVSVPVFDGNLTRSRESAARARERLAREQLRKTELSLQLELEQARLAHALARAEAAVARARLGQAREAATLSRDRFAAGTLLSTELIGVESRLVGAEAGLAMAAARERTALAALRRAAGKGVLE